MATLNQAPTSSTYRDIFKYVQSLIVAAQVPNQTPQLEATHADDLNLPFLGMPMAPGSTSASLGKRSFTVSYDATYGWIMDAGAIYGIPPSTLEETTQLALFPFLDNLEARSSANAIAKADVLEVLPQLSRIKITDISAVREGGVYRAIATSMPLVFSQKNNDE